MTWESIGNGVKIELTRDHVDRFTGLVIEHEGCEAQRIKFALPWVERESEQDVWHVHQWEPLTLHPSLLCDTCGLHGYIRDGVWVPANEAASKKPLEGSEKLPVSLTVGVGSPMPLGEIEVRTVALKGSDSWTLSVDTKGLKRELAKILRAKADELEADS